MADYITESIMEDEVDAVVDDALDNEEIELSSDEEDGIFADTPVGIDYDDEEEEYEDPYIVYDLDEETEADDEEDEDIADDEDPFIREAAVMKVDMKYISEEEIAKEVYLALQESDTEEEKETVYKTKAEDLVHKLNMFKSKGYKNWQKSSEGKKSRDYMNACIVIDAICSVSCAICFALGGIAVPTAVIYGLIIGAMGVTGNAAVSALNKEYARKFSKSDMNKLKHYIDKANKCADAMESKAKETKDPKKAKKYHKTAKEYRVLANKFKEQYDYSKL